VGSQTAGMDTSSDSPLGRELVVRAVAIVGLAGRGRATLATAR
jgi:hypothetical protein